MVMVMCYLFVNLFDFVYLLGFWTTTTMITFHDFCEIVPYDRLRTQFQPINYEEKHFTLKL